MAKKRNIIVGQSGGPTSVINSSLAGVYKTAKERGFHKVYGMLHGIQGFLDEQYVDLSTQIHSDMDIELLKRTPSAFLGSCRFKLPDIHKILIFMTRFSIYWTNWISRPLSISAATTPWIPSRSCQTMQS